MMKSKHCLHLFSLIVSFSAAAWHPTPGEGLPKPVVEFVASTLLKDHCAVFSFLNQKEFMYDHIVQDWARWGLGVFEVSGDGHNGNATQAHLSRVVSQAYQLRRVSQCLTVVVVSDDPAFLTAFAKTSDQERLMVWSMRLLVLTRLSLTQLQGLQKLLSTTDSMLLVVQREIHDTRWSCGPVQSSITLASHFLLFQDKFTIFISAPTLIIAIEILPYHKIFWVDDPNAPAGRRLEYTGATDKIVKFLAQGMNFAYQYVRPTEGTFGVRLANGSWDGMVGMVMREEVDFAPGSFILSSARNEVIDYTWPVESSNMRVLAAIGRPEVDPWSFIMPLAPVVWMGIIAFIVIIPTVMLISSKLAMFEADYRPDEWMFYSMKIIRVFLQQDLCLNTAWWWWERVMVGVWMLMTLVLTRSYAGTLMSLLAVRHIPQPYQSVKDVLDDPSITMIWQKSSANELYLRTVESGMFREVAETEDDGRLIFRFYYEFLESMETLVERGDHVLIENSIDMTNLMVQHFSARGECIFYLSREGYLPYTSAPITQKGNPLGRAISKRVMALWEAGLYNFWYISSIPNSTSCKYLPTKLLINSLLSMANLWGMFVVLGGGGVTAGVVLCLESVVAYSLKHFIN